MNEYQWMQSLSPEDLACWLIASNPCMVCSESAYKMISRKNECITCTEGICRYLSQPTKYKGNSTPRNRLASMSMEQFASAFAQKGECAFCDGCQDSQLVDAETCRKNITRFLRKES